ncbi:hypothetical protein F2Q69_00023442 [Brassica cretica]|uniref:Uncharacterized protein n=1 Tax=Brassica cretica TaxID=69181 RepID=A0A8S9QTC6_BRACR|nr:hypothetical protein F2Q69_00023442 [Brassica cretica]
MSISKLNFEIGSANSQLHHRFTVDTEGTRERARYHWKDLDSRFSDHLSDCQVDFAFTTSLEMKLLWLSKWCPIGVNLVSTDRGHIGIHYDRRDLKSRQGPFGVSSGFFRTRGKETSGLAMLLVRVCGAETFVPWMLLERAGASCLFMLELNFHSGSSIYSNENDEQE